MLFLAAGATFQISSSSLFQESVEACRAVGEQFADIDKQRSELAVYLCEDSNKLSLEELFGTMRTFRELFIKALKVRKDALLAPVLLTMHPFAASSGPPIGVLSLDPSSVSL